MWLGRDYAILLGGWGQAVITLYCREDGSGRDYAILPGGGGQAVMTLYCREDGVRP